MTRLTAWLLSFTVPRLAGCYHSQRHDWLFSIIHSTMIDWLLSFTAPWFTGCYNSQRHDWLFSIIHSAMIDCFLSFTAPRLTGCYNSQRHDWLIAIIHSAMIDWLLSFTAPRLIAIIHGAYSDSYLLANILWYYSTVPLRWYAQCSSFLHFSIDWPTVCLFFDKHFVHDVYRHTEWAVLYTVLFHQFTFRLLYLLVLTYISFNLRVHTANLNFANFMFTYFTIR